MSVIKTNIKSLLTRLENGGAANEQELAELLDLTDPDLIRLLCDAAGRVRARHFGARIFFYGFLYFSTYCRNNCRFCQYCRANTEFGRYRKSPEEILAAAEKMAATGVHLIDLTMGEDPLWHEKGPTGFDHLTQLARRVKDATGLPVMMSPGVVPDKMIEDMARDGIQWYACYQETHNRELYAALRPGQGFDQRMAKKQAARDAGMLVEEGLLTGVGETSMDIAQSILWMKDFGVDQARVMTFVPQTGTPMADVVPQTRAKELNTIAVMRLVLQDCLIPASLDVDGLDGLADRLTAGANVVTSIVPPDQGLAGVANHSLDIEDSRRSLDHVLPVLAASGFEAAKNSEYLDWITRRRVENDRTVKQAG